MLVAKKDTKKFPQNAIIDLEKNIAQETKSEFETEEQTTEEGDQGGEDPFLDIKDFDVIALVKIPCKIIYINTTDDGTHIPS